MIMMMKTRTCWSFPLLAVTYFAVALPPVPSVASHQTPACHLLRQGEVEDAIVRLSDLLSPEAACLPLMQTAALIEVARSPQPGSLRAISRRQIEARLTPWPAMQTSLVLAETVIVGRLLLMPEDTAVRRAIAEALRVRGLDPVSILVEPAALAATPAIEPAARAPTQVLTQPATQGISESTPANVSATTPKPPIQPDTPVSTLNDSPPAVSWQVESLRWDAARHFLVARVQQSGAPSSLLPLLVLTQIVAAAQTPEILNRLTSIAATSALPALSARPPLTKPSLAKLSLTRQALPTQASGRQPLPEHPGPSAGPVLVKAGQRVPLMLSQRGMKIRLVAVCLEPGRAQQSIRVLLHRGRVIRAQVVSRGQLQAEF